MTISQSKQPAVQRSVRVALPVLFARMVRLLLLLLLLLGQPVATPVWAEETAHFAPPTTEVALDGAASNAPTVTHIPGLSRRAGATDGFIHTDWLGSTRHISRAVLTSNFKGAYDAYGKLVASEGDGNEFRFRWGGGWGYQSEPAGAANDVGLVLMGQRYYDPEVGRFLSPDPIGFAGGLNLYAYCGGDPVNAVDPTGLHCEGFDDGANDIAAIADSYMGAMRRIRTRGAQLVGENLTTGFALVPGGNGADWGKAVAQASEGDWRGAGGTLGLAYSPNLAMGALRRADVGAERVGEYLQGLGRHVAPNPLEGAIGAGRQGDLFVDGVLHEVKTLAPGATSNTIRNTIRRSLDRGGQARNFVIDARGSGLSRSEAQAAVSRVYGNALWRDRVDYIAVLGDDYFWGAARR